MMRRRQILGLGGAISLASLSGCISRNPLVANAKFSFTPPNPTVGESIVFDASESNAIELEWFIDESAQVFGIDKTGEVMTHEFDEPGAHTVTLRATAPFGVIPGLNIDRTTKPIYVESKGSDDKSNDNPINVATDNVSIQLRGLTTRTSINDTAVLMFDAVNLSEERISIKLVLKIPSGLQIRSSSFVESGGGQYAATFKIAPGENARTRIQVEPTRVGQFEITGIADYTTPEGVNKTNKGDVSLIVTDD
jgi:PKD repeat protein